MFATALPVDVSPAGGRLVAVDGRTLPLRGTRLEADACAGRCRVTLLQSFANPYAEPLEVTYQVPLPADGAVSGYAFHIGELRIVGRIDRLADARRSFAEAVMEGRTAALLEQDRSSLFTQRVGNIPPGQEVVVELTIDQPLTWTQGGWEWRFPTVVAPRYLGQHTADAARVAVDVAAGEISARVGLRLSIRDARTGRVTSPSHAVTDGDTVVLDGADARLDRDVVVRWPVAAQVPGVVLDTGRRAGDALAYGALTLVPPAVAQVSVPRDLIVLLDTSGSMGGAPLDQAKAVTKALIEGLDDTDRLELMEFSNEPRSWQRGAVFATPKAKADAIRWVSGLRASGGTEMRTGILAALHGLRAEAQRQVVLVTDGLIGFEHMVVQAIRDTLPAGSRVHTLGIGSGVNRSLTGPSARAGGGLELIVAPGEDPMPAAAQLLARTRSPQVVDLEISGSAVQGVAPRRLPDLFAGSPARLAVALDAHGGELVVRGRSAYGLFEHRITVPPTASGAGQAAVAALYGREIVEDLELDRAAGGTSSVDRAIEEAGLSFQIATRLTAWIATTTHVTVDPRASVVKETMPHALPHGMSAEGAGLRAAAAPMSNMRTQAGIIGGFGGPGGGAGMPPPAPQSVLPVVAPAPARARSEVAAPPPPATQASTGAPAPADGMAPPAEAAKGRGGLLGRVADSLRRARPAAGAAAPEPMAPQAPMKKEAQRAEKSAVISSADADDFAVDLELAAPRDMADEAEEGVAEDRPRLAEGGPARPYATLRGRLVLLRADRLVVEIDLTGPTQWRPGTEVTLRLADGTERVVKVDLALTTADGEQAGGRTLRLVLALDGELPAAPSRITFDDGTMITL